MEAPKQHCPRCEAPDQSFRPQWSRKSDGRIEVYIRCTVCRWRSVLRVSTPEIETLLKQEKIVLQRHEREQARYGQPSNSAKRNLTSIRTELAQRQRELRDSD